MVVPVPPTVPPTASPAAPGAGTRLAPPIVLVSNRGPLSWRRDGEQLIPRRGAGGLVSGLAPLVAGTDALWIASALGDDDREAAAAGLTEGEGLRSRLLAHPPDVLRSAYDVVGNGVLWFIHHGLYDLARRPRFDRVFAQAWQGYRTYNDTFAAAVVESAPPDAVVLVQDSHLALAAPAVRAARPDLRLVHFSHTPFAGPDWLSVLPDPYRAELLAGMAANHACCFHTERWRAHFEASCGAFAVAPPHTAVTPLGPEPADLASVAASPATAEAGQALDEAIGDRKLIVRVDRIELSKNLLRGIWAYDELLTSHPEWRERVSFAALVYPSREGLAEYLAYRQEVDYLVAKINARWATPGWVPILFDPRDDFPRSVAALRRYDVLLVNPIRDGMNLVAKEGPLVNQRDGVVVLSNEAGAWDELCGGVLGVHPYDITGTAETLAAALALPAAERRARAQRLRDAVLAQGPEDWLVGQLAAAAAGG
jgi:trehalose 6-phosphate synthase